MPAISESYLGSKPVQRGSEAALAGLQLAELAAKACDFGSNLDPCRSCSVFNSPSSPRRPVMSDRISDPCRSCSVFSSPSSPRRPVISDRISDPCRPCSVFNSPSSPRRPVMSDRISDPCRSCSVFSSPSSPRRPVISDRISDPCRSCSVFSSPSSPRRPVMSDRISDPCRSCSVFNSPSSPRRPVISDRISDPSPVLTCLQLIEPPNDCVAHDLSPSNQATLADCCDNGTLRAPAGLLLMVLAPYSSPPVISPSSPPTSTLPAIHSR